MLSMMWLVGPEKLELGRSLMAPIPPTSHANGRMDSWVQVNVEVLNHKPAPAAGAAGGARGSYCLNSGETPV